MSQQMSSSRAIGLIARREFTVQVMKKSFIISNVIILAVIVGGIIAFSIFSGADGEERDVVGVVGDQSIASVLSATGDAVGNPVEVREIGDANTARSDVESGDVAVALVPAGSGSYTPSPNPSSPVHCEPSSKEASKPRQPTPPSLSRASTGQPSHRTRPMRS